MILLFFSAFFSSAETALLTADRIRLRTLSEDGSRKADRVLEILDKQDKMLSAILIGNNIVNLSASSLATVLAVRLLGSIGAGVATFIVTFFILIVGEITPKKLATMRAEGISLAIAPIIKALMIILTPAIVIVNAIASALIRLFGADPNEDSPQMTEDELRTIVDVGHESGVIESDERQIINNLFDFGDAEAKEIMVPRIDMICLPLDARFDELMDLYREHRLTRYPVYETSPDNIIGFINMKDVLLIEHTDDFHVKNILRQPYYTHEHKNTSELMVEMRAEHTNISIILDEYGTTIGMITLEDLLEEIVGEIRDEYDDDEIDEIRPLTETEYEISGITNLDTINDALGLELNSEDYETIGGYVIGLSDSFPSEGQEFHLEDGTLIRVLEMDNNRIETLYLSLPLNKHHETD